MESQHTPVNEGSSPAEGQETIFSDMVDTAPFEKSLKTARIWLYVIAALQAGIGIYEYTTTADQEVAIIAGLIDAGIGVVFLLLALWSYKKPAIAFMTALILYLVILSGMMILEPANIYRGIILKIIIVVALVKAFKNAKEVEKLKESVG